MTPLAPFSLRYDELPLQIQVKEYTPDIVVCINRGGVLPGVEVARELQVPCSSLTVQRPFNTVEIYKRMPKFIAEWYQVFLSLTMMPEVVPGIHASVMGKKLLMVDDAVHTGKTFRVATEYVSFLAPREVRTATLTYVRRQHADFALKKGRYQFPWSRNSPEFEEYNEYLLRARDYLIKVA